MASPHTTRIGILICGRYASCAGGKCFRALRERAGAFAPYAGREVEVVGFATCGGCPGGNVEVAPEEMRRNGAEVVHLATGLLVGYPPCPRLDAFMRFIPEKFGLRVVAGTHPIPQKYYATQERLKTWNTPRWRSLIGATTATEEIRATYD